MPMRKIPFHIYEVPHRRYAAKNEEELIQIKIET